jgi:hypothetical protein
MADQNKSDPERHHILLSADASEDVKGLFSRRQLTRICDVTIHVSAFLENYEVALGAY